MTSSSSVTSAESDGALLILDVRLPAGGGQPMLHRHAATEVYRVERGELAIYREDEEGAVARIAAGPGSVVHIPGGRPHTVRNETGEDAAAFVVFTPGEDFERFVREAGALAAQRPLEPVDVLGLTSRHGIEMAGPVPAAVQG